MHPKIASACKLINSKIHPPLPLTARSSQQLLSLLDASFKQQLDGKDLAASSSNEDHADLHLQSILKNPLFDAKPRMRDTSTSKGQGIGLILGQLQNQMVQPVDVFKELVSQGTADLQKATHCLNSQYKRCKTSSAGTPTEAMRTSGAASTILQWLWSSGMEDTGIFLNDLHLAVTLVPFLVAEGQQSCISRWLRRFLVSVRTPVSDSGVIMTRKAQRVWFQQLIAGELCFGGGLKSAINLFLSTIDDLRSSGHCQKSIGLAANGAAWTLTERIIQHPKPADLEPTVIHAFVETIKQTKYDKILKATLCIYVQEPPDPHSAIKSFQNTTPKLEECYGAARRADIVLLGLRVAELLLQDGSRTKALWMMEFLETKFGQDLGSLQPPVLSFPKSGPRDLTEIRKDEKRNLSLLDALPV